MKLPSEERRKERWEVVRNKLRQRGSGLALGVHGSFTWRLVCGRVIPSWRTWANAALFARSSFKPI